MTDDVLNSTTLRLAVPKRLDECVAQARRIIDMHGGDVKMLVLGVNAVEGKGFRPLTGYAIELALDAKFVPGHYDTQDLFRGRCLLPLIPPGVANEKTDTAMGITKKSLSGKELLAMYQKAREQALEENNDDPDQLTLMDSTSDPGWCCLMLDEATDTYFVAVEAQMLPDHDALGEDISTYLAREAGEITVSQAFFGGHPVARTMIRYLEAQNAFRDSFCRRLRAMMLQHFVGHTFDGQESDPAVHFVANIANKSPEGDSFLYYSNMIEGTMEGGALVHGGPFKRSVWVNWNGEGGTLLADAEKLRAVPFSMPTDNSVPRTLERIIESRADPEKRDKDDFAALSPGNKIYTHLSHELVKSLPSESGKGPISFGRREGTIIGDLVFPHYKHHTGDYYPIISPYEYLGYVRGLEFEGTRNAMKEYGIDLTKAAASIATLSPLFCASDSPSIQTVLALAEAAAVVK